MYKRVFSSKTVPDLTLLFTILTLLGIGLLMIYSSSYVWADYTYNDSLYFVKRQLFFSSLGFILMCFTMFIPYQRWKNLSFIIFIICLILLIAVLVPGIGLVRGGARSWIGVGAFSIQPSEFMKLGLIIFLAALLSSGRIQLTSLFRGFLPMILLIVAIFSLIMLQPDLGTGIVLVGTCMIVIYIAGAQMAHMFSLVILGLIGFSWLIISAPYRIKRITSFLNPWEDPLGDGFQMIQSLYAVGPGGLIGVGLGNSLQKYLYLPEPQTDFIFSILAEEVGLIGSLTVIILFVIICWRGFIICLNTTDRFATYLSLGIVMMLSIQVMINISVVIGLIPVTGITLPLISYGGSSLLLTLCSLGILLNISRYSNE